MRLASPKIIFCKEEYTEELTEQINRVCSEVHKARFHAGTGSIRFFRQPSEDGEFNLKSLSNKIHRASVHMAYYFADPVIVNYNGAIEKDDILACVRGIRYTDLGRIYWVEMNPDLTFTMNLMVNRNVEFTTFNDISVERDKVVENV